MYSIYIGWGVLLVKYEPHITIRFIHHHHDNQSLSESQLIRNLGIQKSSSSSSSSYDDIRRPTPKTATEHILEPMTGSSYQMTLSLDPYS